MAYQYMDPMDKNGSNENGKTEDSDTKPWADIESERPAWMDNTGGLTVVTACIFIIGEMAGSGVLALPKAIADIGWIGLLLVVVFALLAAYTGSILGQCWTILQERFPEYREHTRYPYPAIGFRAYGNPGRVAVSIANNVTLFAVCTVYTILASQIVQELFADLSIPVNISFCYWLLILGGFITPFTWFGSPKNMWPIAIGAMSTTGVACILILIKLGLIEPKIIQPRYPNPELKSAFLSFGVILFSFGNHPIFPTIQHDMQHPKNFTKAVFLGYLGVMCMYFPVAAYGYVVFGDSVQDNLLLSINKISTGPLLNSIQILLMTHLLFGFVIAVNPLCQELEQLANVKKHFSWQRVLLRTCVVIVIIFVAETVPRFGAILSLIGGSTITLLCYVFPCLFFTKLCSTKGNWKERILPMHQKVLHIEIIVVSLLGGIAATYAAVETIVSPNTFVPPCYVNGMK